MKKLYDSLALLCLSTATCLNAEQRILWQDLGDLDNNGYTSSVRGLSAGSAVTSIADPTGSERGAVLSIDLSGGSSGTEWGSLEMASSPYSVASKVVWDSDIIPGTTQITLRADVYIPSTSTLGSGDSVGFLVRTEANNQWWDNNLSEWTNSFNTPNADTAITDQWQTIEVTVAVPAEAGGAQALTGLFPLLSFNDINNDAGSGVYAYVDNIRMSVDIFATPVATEVTMDASSHRIINGTRFFDRYRYLNIHGDGYVPSSVSSKLWDPNEIFVTQTRYSSSIDQIISQIWWGTTSGVIEHVAEDLNNTGFLDPTELLSSIGNMNDWINSGDTASPNYSSQSRFIGIQEHSKIGSSNNNVIVLCGRNIAGRYPSFMLTNPDTPSYSSTDVPMHFASYADAVSQIIEHQEFPVDSDRFYFEVMNEPNFTHDVSDAEIIALHNEVPPLVRANHPNLLIGGPSFGATAFRNLSGWGRYEAVMSGAGAQLDFWTWHPYDRYDISNTDTVSRSLYTSAGRVSAVLDTIDSHSFNLFGTPKYHAITEYGAWVLNSGGSYNEFSREDLMWNQVNALLEKMMVFMDRPDRILVATPFINTYAGGSGSGLPTSGDKWGNNLWVDDDSDSVIETTVASLFRMLHDVTGSYIEIESSTADVQTHAFRNGSTVYLILNNLSTDRHDITLNLSAGDFGTISAATRRRLWVQNGEANYDSGTVLGSWNSLILEAEEKSLLVLTVSGNETYMRAYNEERFYGDAVVQALSANAASANVEVDLTQAIEAKVRVSFMRENDVSVPSVTISVNGNNHVVPAGTTGYDDSDPAVTSREISVPVAQLLDGTNSISATFPDSDGHLLAVVVEVTKRFGDYNGNDELDALDRQAIAARKGTSVSASTEQYDLDGSGVIDDLDLIVFDNLRGTDTVVLLEVKQLVPDTGTNQVQITWASTLHKTYSIEVRPSLDAGSWTTLQSGISATGNTTTYTGPSGVSQGSRGFYRVVQD
ncbi:hypothetical protein [Coraliomargarita akajimensis]|uniref:Uncharacterized protein n=1 Tax=Coraliomargarita akajimensis (strain DSM 45221 / IAM 15411 / JCM 23193 / KCTC 12865 / 04OKA010-24) TaxID=583355 RepID=D5EHJ5_CORAD|nr:hypothetical protein [Coraliomargarita akajimensis]ADE54036.1 hypothetical protein Caka_1014 [Coraliomargarita akajimensis DSM 45221]